jgi:hypothetical protein
LVPGRRLPWARKSFAAAKRALNPNPKEHVMSKLMVIFILLVSGSLYDPQRVLSHLGPDASAIGWKLKHAIPGIRMN